MSYMHHYAMLLPVDGMIEEGPIGLTPEKIAAALRGLADKIEGGKVDLLQMFGRGGPVSAEQEDRWVLRAADRKNIMRKAAGGWVEVQSQLIDLEDTVTGAAAAKMLMTLPEHWENALWCRMESIGDKVLLAKFIDEDNKKSFSMDLNGFVAFAPEYLVEAIASQGWRPKNDEDILEHLCEAREPAALAMRDHLLAAPGSEMSLVVENVAQAEAFLKDTRPDLYSRIVDAQTLTP